MKNSIPPTNPENEEIDLPALAATLWEEKWLIATTTLFAIICGIVALIITPPTYQANALLQIEDSSPSLAVPKGIADLMGSGAKSSKAELELLHARLTLGTAVAKMHLDWISRPIPVPFIGYAVTGYDLPLPNWRFLSQFARANDSITLSDLKVPPEWLGIGIKLTYNGSGSFIVKLPDGTSLTGNVGLTLANQTQTFAVTVESIQGAPGRAYVIQQMSELEAIDILDAALADSEQGRDTGVVRVTFKGPDPDRNRRTLDAILDAFHGQNLSRSSAEAEKSLEFVQGQIPEAEARQKAAEKALNDYRLAQKSVDLTFETQSLLTETQTTEGKLRELGQGEEDIKRKYAADHPVYKQFLDARKALQDRLDQLAIEIANLPETQKEVLNLTRELATAQAANDALAERAQELGVLKASTIGTVRIVDPAATPLKPIAPRKSLTLALASLLGVVLGVALALLRDRLRRGIEGSAQIEALDIPVFATISLHLTKANIKGNAPIGDILCRDNRDSIIVEEFKSLRTSLHFAMLDAKNQSIGITSGAPGVGKSFVSANIAAVSASAGFKVCLIDADMRRGRQRVRFGFKRSVAGLSEFLSGEIGLESVLHPTNIEGLTFLPTGAFPPNPSELLMRNHFSDLISSLCERFDLVVVDCPPILAVTDAAVIGRTLGANFIVARHQVTELGEIVASRTALDAAGVPLKGAILNAFDRRKARNQGGNGGKYGYSYAYSYAYKTLEKD